MPNRQTRFVGLMFLVVAGLSVLAGILPMLRDGRPNIVFLGIAVVWLVLGVAKLRQQRSGT